MLQHNITMKYKHFFFFVSNTMSGIFTEIVHTKVKIVHTKVKRSVNIYSPTCCSQTCMTIIYRPSVNASISIHFQNFMEKNDQHFKLYSFQII